MTNKSEAQKQIEGMAPDQLENLKGLIDAETERRGEWNRIPQMGHAEFNRFSSELFHRADMERQRGVRTVEREDADKAAQARVEATERE